MGAVAWDLWPSPRFPSPLIKPDVPISGIRLSGWLHRKAHDGAARRERSKHWRAPPSLCNRAFSEGSGSFQALPRLIANHLHLTIVESAPEVRVLCSTSVTRHQRSYDPVRLPL